MSCIFCRSWNQTDANCGHFMLEGFLMPARTATRAMKDREVFGGGRASTYARAENDGTEFGRLQHIENIATHALSGGWG